MVKATLFTGIILLFLVPRAKGQDQEFLGRKYLREANAHYAKGEYKEAMAKYQLALQNDPSNVKSGYNL
ncbi:MAG TPA: hypothetical protein DEP18_07605, partial [Flavobacteriales bacterium]|nr:hypothetical protein [Flavobacteriales bacterium]